MAHPKTPIPTIPVWDYDYDNASYEDWCGGNFHADGGFGNGVGANGFWIGHGSVAKHINDGYSIPGYWHSGDGYGGGTGGGQLWGYG